MYLQTKKHRGLRYPPKPGRQVSAGTPLQTSREAILSTLILNFRILERRKQFGARLLDLCYFVRTDSEITTDWIHLLQTISLFLFHQIPRNGKAHEVLLLTNRFDTNYNKRMGMPVSQLLWLMHQHTFKQLFICLFVVFKHFFLRTWEIVWGTEIGYLRWTLTHI